MNAATLGAWLRQRTTQAGIVGLVGAVSGYEAGALTQAVAITAACSAIAAMLAPDVSSTPPKE